MASNPPSTCCYKGVAHTGVATGSLTKVGSYDCYAASPPKPSNLAIIILTDVLGHKFLNAQLLADAFAADGYHVLMPDLFYGDALSLNRPDDFDLQKWLTQGGPMKGHGMSTVDPIVKACIEELRGGQTACEKVAGVGYCFGAKPVVRFLKPGMLDAGYVAHPSFVAVEELRSIDGPLSIAAAEIDQIFTVERRHQSEQVLLEGKKRYQINLYGGVAHGFAVRGDPKDNVQRYAKEVAFVQALQWFEEHLKG